MFASFDSFYFLFSFEAVSFIRSLISASRLLTRFSLFSLKSLRLFSRNSIFFDSSPLLFFNSLYIILIFRNFVIQMKTGRVKKSQFTLRFRISDSYLDPEETSFSLRLLIIFLSSSFSALNTLIRSVYSLMWLLNSDPSLGTVRYSLKSNLYKF